MGSRLDGFWHIRPKTSFLLLDSKHDDPNVTFDYLDATNHVVESITCADLFFFSFLVFVVKASTTLEA